mmetsp:Transcript_5774/g.14791  ORF Transcript_5774/g.14791 Transcript_5774/m.14791 type:complete len:351 (-) Transcript_5774:109-1161(-)
MLQAARAIVRRPWLRVAAPCAVAAGAGIIAWASAPPSLADEGRLFLSGRDGGSPALVSPERARELIYSHVSERATHVLVEPPTALRRFGDTWRKHVSKELCDELEARRAVLQKALDSFSRTSSDDVHDSEVEKLWRAIAEAEGTVRVIRAHAAEHASRIDWPTVIGDKSFVPLSEGLGSAQRVSAADLQGKIVALYFTAGWCGPCHGFTPRLAEAFNHFRSAESAHKQFEIIQISWDHDEAGFGHYVKRLRPPWLALPFDERELARELSLRYNVAQIPALVVLEIHGTEARVLTDSGRQDVELYLEARHSAGLGPGEQLSTGDVAEWIRLVTLPAPAHQPARWWWRHSSE